MSDNKMLSPSMEADVCKSLLEPLRAEIARLTRELDEAKAENERLRTGAPGKLHRICDALNEQAAESPFSQEEWDRVDKQTAEKNARLAELEARLAWRKVSEPPADGVEVLTCHAESGVINACIRLPNKFESLETGDRMDKDVTHWREIGPLPDAPHEAEPPRDKP